MRLLINCFKCTSMCFWIRFLVIPWTERGRGSGKGIAGKWEENWRGKGIEGKELREMRGGAEFEGNKRGKGIGEEMVGEWEERVEGRVIRCTHNLSCRHTHSPLRQSRSWIYWCRPTPCSNSATTETTEKVTTGTTTATMT